MKDNKNLLITAIAMWAIMIIAFLMCGSYFMNANKEENTSAIEKQKAEKTAPAQESSPREGQENSNEDVLHRENSDGIHDNMDYTFQQEQTNTETDVDDFHEEQKNLLNDIEKEDGLVTLEYLQGLTWTEIRDNADELFGERKVDFREEGDDALLRDIVYNIDRELDVLDIEDYISSGGDTELKHTDYETFCKKIQAIVDAYNEENKIQVICYTNQYSNGTGLHYELYSYNYPVTHIGQVARIKWGPSYYESSRRFGSGWSCSTIYTEDYGFAQLPYLPEDGSVTVNGVSYLSDRGKILSSQYYTYDEIIEQSIFIPIDMSKKYMLHICTAERDLGWVLPATLDVMPEEKA